MDVSINTPKRIWFAVSANSAVIYYLEGMVRPYSPTWLVYQQVWYLPR